MHRASIQAAAPWRLIPALAFFVSLFAASICFGQTSPATLPDLKLSSAGLVRALAVQSDGKVIIAGQFALVDDMVRPAIARLNPNGSLDRSWNPPSFPSVDNVKVIVVNGAYAYLGGAIVAPGTNALVRLSLIDGGLDPTWNPRVSGVVECLAVDNANVYFGGSFTAVSGVARTNLARASITGSGVLDTNWTATASGVVQRMTLDGTNLFIAGRFLSPRPSLAKISTITGTMDTNWSPSVALVITGNFTGLRISGTSLYVANDNVNALPAAGVAKLSTTGSGAADTNWNPVLPAGNSNLALNVTPNFVFIGGVASNRTFSVKADAGGVGTVDSTWNQNARLDDASNEGAEIRALAVTTSALFLGGSFVSSGGAVSLGLSKLDLVTGLRRDDFPAQVQLPGTVNSLARQLDGKLIVGGRFQLAGALARRNLARITEDGEIDSTWAPDVDGEILALALGPTNVYVGGKFTKAGGLNRTNLARIATATSDAADASWDAGITNAAASVTTLTVSGTNVYVGGGLFGRIGGQNRNGLAKLSTVANTNIGDPLWNPDPKWSSALPNAINSIVIFGNDVIVGGVFTNIANTNRSGLVKLTSNNGTVVPPWNPSLLPNNNNNEPRITALVAAGTNLFVGGSFIYTNASGVLRSNLVKLRIPDPGQVDVSWNATGNSSPIIQALGVDNQELLVGGAFSDFGGLSRTNLVRVSTTGGVADTAFNPNPNGSVSTLLVRGARDVYVGGAFGFIGGASRSSFAFLTEAAAPVFIQDSATNLFLTRNPSDGSEITHFRITEISNGTLYFSNSLTAISPGDFITVAQGEAGLTFWPGIGGTLKAVSAVNATPPGAGTNEAMLTMVTNPGPVLKFAPATYSVREGDGNVIVTVRKYGFGATNATYFTTGLSALSGVDFQSRSNTLNFSDADTFGNIVIAIADDLHTQGDRLFLITLTNAVIAGSRSAEVTIVDNDKVGETESVTITTAPSPPARSDGVLIVSLQPTNGLWRLLGELNWHTNGAAVFGLATNNYTVEFQPLTCYHELDEITLPLSAGVTNFYSFDYSTNTGCQSGFGQLTMFIEPANVATNTNVVSRGQWRRKYVETGTTWHDSGEAISNVPGGYHTVEFKTVTNYATPPDQLIQVGVGATYGGTATYLFATTTGAQLPGVVPYQTATSNQPYVFIGQLQTSVGFSSGFVVKPRVVLTVAHALFDDLSLSYVTSARWFFQRYRDQMEPVPLTPRGWYVFEGYSAQREADESPGVSTPESQQLDAAAMYFLEDAGRGGAGGYLSSDAANNEFLLSANNKFLAGYPIDGVAETDQGKLHATTPMNLAFSHLYNSVFATTNVESGPGTSGGPLYVLHYADNENKYLPAGIYLGGSGETLVRAIDGSIVDLINRAEESGNGGGNNTGGGTVNWSYGTCTDCAAFGYGKLTVNLASGAGVGGWRVTNDVTLTGTNYITNGTYTIASVLAGSYDLEFKAVPGYLAPSNITIQVTNNSIVIVTASYLLPIDVWRSATFGTNASENAIAGNDADPDGDLVPNFLEYAFGTDPNVANASVFRGGVTNLAGTNYLFVLFTRPTNNIDLTYRVLVSSNLFDWLTGAVYSASTTVTSNANTVEIGHSSGAVENISVRDATAATAATNRFMRVRVSLP